MAFHCYLLKWLVFKFLATKWLSTINVSVLQWHKIVILSQELRCAVLITEENIHVLNHLSPPTLPLKLLPTGETRSPSENRVSDHLGLILSCPVTDICQIVFGIFEQKIRLYCGISFRNLKYILKLSFVQYIILYYST